jgi:hypothetical protein|uniref:Uncharacterized protein n=1 Tax=viral metagenome TaxID=1070528 RepID=A0A6C0IUQ4_9ZZZZ
MTSLYFTNVIRGGLAVPSMAGPWYQRVQSTLQTLLVLHNRMYNAIPFIMARCENDYLKTLFITLLIQIALCIGVVLYAVVGAVSYTNKFFYDLNTGTLLTFDDDIQVEYSDKESTNEEEEDHE